MKCFWTESRFQTGRDTARCDDMALSELSVNPAEDGGLKEGDQVNRIMKYLESRTG